MSSPESLSYALRAARLPWTHPLRHLLAASLALASAVLAAMARRVAVPVAVPREPSPLELEFYAEASAPEGALYVDGELVGYLRGVHRL